MPIRSSRESAGKAKEKGGKGRASKGRVEKEVLLSKTEVAPKKPREGGGTWRSRTHSERGEGREMRWVAENSIDRVRPLWYFRKKERNNKKKKKGGVRNAGACSARIRKKANEPASRSQRKNRQDCLQGRENQRRTSKGDKMRSGIIRFDIRKGGIMKEKTGAEKISKRIMHSGGERTKNEQEWSRQSYHPDSLRIIENQNKKGEEGDLHS